MVGLCVPSSWDCSLLVNMSHLNGLIKLMIKYCSAIQQVKFHVECCQNYLSTKGCWNGTNIFSPTNPLALWMGLMLSRHLKQISNRSIETFEKMWLSPFCNKSLYYLGFTFTFKRLIYWLELWIAHLRLWKYCIGYWLL